MQREVDRLVDQLSQANFEDCGPILDEFFLDAHADALLVGSDGRIADVNSDLVIKSVYDESVAISIRSDGEADLDSEAMTSMTFAQDALFAQVQFADRDEPYSLYVTPHVQAENLAVRALGEDGALAAAVAAPLLAAVAPWSIRAASRGPSCG